MDPDVSGKMPRERLRAVVERAFLRAHEAGRPVLACIAERVPEVDPLTLFQRSDVGSRFFWERPDEGFSLCGLGSALHMGLGRDRRVEGLESRWRQATRDAVVVGDPDAPLVQPLATGGLAFDPERARSGAWSGFGNGELSVPAWAWLSTRDSGCWLYRTLLVPQTADLDELLDEEASLPPVRALEPQAEGINGTAVELTNGARHWTPAVKDAIRAIRSDVLEKVVVARRVQAHRAAGFESGRILGHLRRLYPSCTIFAVARGDSCFLGATPEVLVRLNNGLVESSCLAGTRPRGAQPADDELQGQALLADPKDRHEHAVVVRDTKERLARVCTALSASSDPELLKTRDVIHLHTPIRGFVGRSDRTVLGLARELHPTPATCGRPRSRARRFIRDSEPFDRGWYAGAILWLDKTGGGEAAVAIRSALVRGNDAYLYAGCGVVADSDPDREYEESSLKLRPMEGALRS